MKVRRIKFTGHPVLGDLDLDFTDQTGGAASTVVLAGENGTGKTLILEAIYGTLGEVDLARAWRIDIWMEVDRAATRQPWSRPGDGVTVTLQEGQVVQFTLMPETGAGANWNQFSTDNPQMPIGFMTDNRYRPFAVYYSEAETSFRAPVVSSVQTSALDQGATVRRTGSGLAGEITQLLVDIRAADAEELAQWVASHPGEAPPPRVIEPRLKRIKDAIAYLMPNKQMSSVRADQGKMRVTFVENGRPAALDQLSTGEKQLVFRGGFLLRDLDIIQGGLVLVDEPELGLHPTWQARVLGFYERLLPETEEHSTQLVAATHSPFIVHGQSHAKVIILRKEANGAISVDPEPTYPTTGHARVVNALNVPALIQRAQHDTIVLVEGETDGQILEAAWARLRGSQLPFEFRPVLSDTMIRTTLGDDQLFAKNPQKKIIGLFDFDTAYNDWNGLWSKAGVSTLLPGADATGQTKRKNGATAWAMLLPVPAFRSALASSTLKGKSALSIELMFEDAYHLAGMIRHDPLPAAGATVPVMNNRMKTAFARHVVSITDLGAFAAFEPLFVRLEAIRNGQI